MNQAVDRTRNSVPYPCHLQSSVGYLGLSKSLATVERGALRGQGEGGKSKAGLLKSLAVRAMSEAEYVSTGTLSGHQAHGKGTIPNNSHTVGCAGPARRRLGKEKIGLVTFFCLSFVYVVFASSCVRCFG